MLKACLNGPRLPGEHPGLPVTAEAIAVEAASAVAVGADGLHVHPKDGHGADTLDPDTVAEVTDAVRAAVPGVPVGVTTGAWAASDPRERAHLIRRWSVLPDFCSVNWHEPGAPALAEILMEHGVGVEAGLWQPAAVRSWLSWPDRHRCLRILLEVVEDLPAQRAVAHAALLVEALGSAVESTSVLLHGEGTSCWPVFGDAVRRGFDVRIGLEDTLLMPDGSVAGSNADLVAAARRAISQVGLQSG